MMYSSFDEKFYSQEVGKTLFANRYQKDGLTMKEVASTAGVDVATYRKWEKGIATPDLLSARRLNDAYGWGLQV